jgi:phosphoribosyl 1,2-cyclic phosphate phosphodiesterase
MQYKITYEIKILGCGPSNGVPSLEKGWYNCDPTNPKNKRTRTSAFLIIKHGEQEFCILIDTSPDFRQQAIANGITKIDSLLYTHAHADHIYGLDDLRGINRLMKKAIPAYADLKTIDYIKSSFSYMFCPPSPYGKIDAFYRPQIEFTEIKPYETLKLNDFVEVTTTLQDHANIETLGFIFNGKVGYATDFVRLPEKTIELYKNLDVLVVSTLRWHPHVAHMCIEEVLELLKYLKPKTAILTHMGAEIDYEDATSKLPKNVLVGYDGMKYSA